MSISVKSITVSIDGNPSNQFKIEISGIKYTMANFVLSQRMLDHSHLNFDLIKDPLEDISETQFKVCSDIIGKQIALNLQTDPMEKEISSFSGDTVADIEFDGFITNASASRHSSQFSIHVSAVSWDGLLDDDRDCQVWEEKSLKDIVDTVLAQAEPLETENDPDFTAEQYLYCAKWNETSYGFLQRLAIRHGEWLYHDGKKLHFGHLPESETIQLSYPSRDITSYGIDMKARHLNINHVTSSSYEDANFTEKGQDKMADVLNDLNEAAYQASVDNFKRPTIENVIAGGFHWELDGSGYMTDLQDRPQAMGRKAGLLTYHGTTLCSKLAIGGKLIVVDNYITDEQSNAKSDVPQDEILITSITHTFNCDDTYQNNFIGISASAKYPPYANAAAVPHAMPCRAWVTDNDDPERMGRVRVTFAWQYEGNQFDREYIYTPWIRVEQRYTGKEKGFYFIPENGEEVMIDFEGGNAEMPYVRASLFNGQQYTDKGWASKDTVSTNEVKAIRTRNGHTIEIHDAGEGGYIKIYDNKKNNYVLTFSTDEKVIRLHSSGNIELSAASDIMMSAGHDIRMVANNDVNIYAVKNMETVVGENNDMVVCNDHSFTVGGHADVNAITKTETVSLDYEFNNSYGGIQMKSGKEGGFVGIYGSEDVVVKAPKLLGLHADEGFVLHGKQQSFITCDDTLEMGAETLHMN